MRAKDLPYFRWRFSRTRGRNRQDVDSAGYFRSLAAEPLEERTLLDGGIAIATTTLTSIATPDTAATAKNPQSKVWQHDGIWWSVLAVDTGTWVARLDGTAWTPVLQISTTTYSADVKPVGDGTIAHVFLFTTDTSKLASLEYVAGAPGTYQFWQVRPALASIPISAGANTGTIDIDSSGRMWQANDATSTIEVHYSDYPYSTWSGPIALATGVGTNLHGQPAGEITAVTALPNGSVGVMWSNHTVGRFGFRTHVDGADPTIWSADEVPASQSAQNIGDGMADDHLHLAVGADGTLYAAVKTAYDAGTASAPEMALLVRHPTVGIQPAYWDPLYAIDGHGTRQIDIVNNDQGYVMFAYAGETGVNDIVYKTIPLADIDPGNPTKFYSQPRQTLLSGMNLKNVNSQKGAFSSDLVMIATQVVNSANYVAGARINSEILFYFVTNTDDSGPGSLRQAILDANAHPGSAIKFSLSTGVHAIQLASMLPLMTAPATFEVPAGMAIEIGTASAFTLGDYAQLTKTGGGALTIAGPQNHAAATTLNANAGMLNLNSDGGTNLTVNASSTIYFNATQHLAALNITGSGAVKLSAGGGKTIVTGGLAITGTGQLDLADNSLVVQATAATKNAVLADVTAKIASGHGTSGPYWIGNGIVSSAAAANPNHLTALGVMLNAQPVFTNFAGEYVGPASILVRYTYYGDTNLSGTIDGTDFALIDNGYNFGLSGWKNGDFDYSGVVDGTDYALIDNGANFQNGPLTPPDAALTVHPQFRISTAGSNTIYDLTGTKFLALEDTLYPAGSEPAVWPTQAQVTHNGPGSSANGELYPVSLLSQINPAIKNGTIVGQMSPLAPWHIWKDLSDGDGIHAGTGTAGLFTIDHTRVDNVEDGYGESAASPTDFTFDIHDVYFSRIHDDAVENDDILSGSISNSLFETHTFLSEKGSSTNPNGVVTIDNCVVELILQPFQGNDSGSYNTAGGYPYPDGLGNGSIFKFYDQGVGNTQVHVKNSVFLVNRAASSSNSSMLFPPGTYENVTVVWLGTGNYPFAAPPGVTITTNRTAYDNARTAFFAAHPQFTGGGVLSAGEMNQLAFAIAQSQMPSQEIDPLTGKPKK